MDNVLIVAFSVAGIQFLYLGILVYSHVRKYTVAHKNPQSISIVVCAHDEEANLKELVPLLLSQDHPDFELIIVEDRSNDGTYDFLLGVTKKDSRLKMVRVMNTPSHINEKKFALTLGIKAAKHDLVLLTDADCRPQSNSWASVMSSQFANEKNIVLGYSSYENTGGFLNLFIRFETLLTGLLYIGFAKLGRPYMGVGRNLAYRKSLFLDNKGFNKMLDVTGGDDDLFVNKYATSTNTSIAIGADVLVISSPKKIWKDFYYQKVRHLAAGKKYNFWDRIILGGFVLSWIACWVLLIVIAILKMYWIATGIIVVRWLLMILLFETSSRRLGDRFESWKIPFLDIVYLFYYIVVGIKAWRTKRIKWKI